MLGSIIGDIIGSRFEFMATQEFIEFNSDFFHPACSFTDDTICLAAITKTSLFSYDHHIFNKQLEETYKDEYLQEVKFHKKSFYSKKYIDQLVENFSEFDMAGYGQKFTIWCKSEIKVPYQSLGNDCLMRISSLPMIFNSLNECLLFCDFATEITHNHPESLKSTHLYIEILWYLLHSEDSLEVKKQNILQFANKYNYVIDSIENYKNLGGFNVLAPETLKRAISSVLNSNSFKETMQNVLLIGSDTDTTACIAGAMSELLFGIDNDWIKLMTLKFNHRNIKLLKNIIEVYKLKNNYSSFVKENLFSNDKKEFYLYIKNLELKDPTAEWDPLEEPENIENYYSDADLKLQEYNNKNQSFLNKIRFYLKNLIQ